MTETHDGVRIIVRKHQEDREARKWLTTFNEYIEPKFIYYYQGILIEV